MTTELLKDLFAIDQLQAIADQVLSHAKHLGASEAEVGVSVNKGFSVSAHEGDVEKIEYHQDKVLEISVLFGKKTGSASISDVRPEAIKSAVAAACHIAKFTSEDPYAGLPHKDELAFNYPQLKLASDWDINVTKAIEIALESERLAKSLDPRIMNAEEASVTTSSALTLYANSLGFKGYFPHTRHEIGCILVAKQGDEMQRDHAYSVSSDPTKLSTVANIAQEAANKTVQRLGARRIKTQRAPVIFIAEEARSLFGHLVAAISGGSIYRKSSFLLDKIGEQIFPEFIHIEELPHLDHALGSSPFDNDGVLTRNNHFIIDGKLQHYALGVYAARKLNLTSTGNAGGVHNLTISTGKDNFSALLEEMGRGLLVTELMGQGVNILTGDYSRGASGFWVENGKIQYPVHEVTIASTLPSMYRNILAIANDIDVRGNVRTGSVLIKDMMIGGE